MSLTLAHYLVLGAIMDTFGMLILTLPLVLPITKGLGYDPVWTGIFLTGIGVISFFLAMFMGERRSPVFPLLLILAGVLLLVQGLLTTVFPVLTAPVLIGAALVIAAVGAILFLVLKK